MAGKYNSRIFTIAARNVFEGTVVPPANLVMAQAGVVEQVFDLSEVGDFDATHAVNPNRNIRLLRMGLFSNFADGLVFMNAAERPIVLLTASTMKYYSTPAGLATFTQGSKVVTGAGGSAYLTDLSAGDYITISGIGHVRIFRVTHVTNDAQFEIADYAMHTANGVTINKINANVSSYAFQYATSNLPVLNAMHSVESLIPIGPNTLLNPTLAHYTVLTGTVVTNGTAIFSTISIDTAFANKPVMFDVVAEIEY